MTFETVFGKEGKHFLEGGSFCKDILFPGSPVSLFCFLDSIEFQVVHPHQVSIASELAGLGVSSA